MPRNPLENNKTGIYAFNEEKIHFEWKGRKERRWGSNCNRNRNQRGGKGYNIQWSAFENTSCDGVIAIGGRRKGGDVMRP